VYKSNNNSEQTVEQDSKATRDALITVQKNTKLTLLILITMQHCV